MIWISVVFFAVHPEFLRASSVLLLALPDLGLIKVACSVLYSSSSSRIPTRFTDDLDFQIKMQPPIKALVFDVLGTVVDWRSGILAEVEAAGRRHGIMPGIVAVT
jgi:hypothetical protein